MRRPEEVQAEADRLMHELGGLEYQASWYAERKPAIVARIKALQEEIHAAVVAAEIAKLTAQIPVTPDAPTEVAQ